MLRLLLAIILILNFGKAYAQYKQHQPFKDYYSARAIGNERIYERFYVGVGKHFIFGDADLHYKGYDTSGNPIDTNINLHVRAKHSYVLFGGTYFPFILISDNSVLAFNIEFMGSYADLTLDSVFFNPKALYKKSESVIMLGVPISLEFKSGGDVSLSTEKKHLFAIGAGLLIGNTNKYVSTADQLPIKPIPFMKLEVGFFAGVAIKLRGIAYFGDAGFIDRATGPIFGGDVLETKTHTGYGYNLSLVVMPFSSGWRSEEWY